MPFAKGTLILVDYTLTVKETGEAIETTVESKAKELSIYSESVVYGPRLIAVNEGWVLRGLDEKLLEMEEGGEARIEIPPEKAFGLRDESKVKIVPLRRFGERAARLKPGDEVRTDEGVGYVRSITSGRVFIDFNNRFAGRTILCDVRVLEELKSDEEKVAGLIRRRLPSEHSKFTTSIRGDELAIEIPKDLYLMEGLQYVKRALSKDFFKYTQIRKVEFVEKYTPEE